MTVALAILIAGSCFAVGVIVGLIAGWRMRGGGAAPDMAAVRAEMARAEIEMDLRTFEELAPRVVGQ